MNSLALLIVAQKQPLPLLLVPILGLLFLAGWVITLLVLSRVSGWYRLTEAYGADLPPDGPRWSWQSARLRAWGSYNNCLTFIAGSEGLWVRPMWPFTVAHRGLFFPWQDVRVERESSWGAAVVRFHFANVPQVSLTISPHLADQLESAVADRLSSDESDVESV